MHFMENYNAMNFHLLLVLMLFICSCVGSTKLNTPKILLPINVGVPSNFTLHASDTATESCFMWSSSHPDIVNVIPIESTCSKSAIVAAVTKTEKPQQAVISVVEKGTTNVIYCDVSVGMIHILELMYQGSTLSLGGPPLGISIIAKDKQGHTFSSFNGLECIWHIEDVNDPACTESTTNVIRMVNFSEQPYKSSYENDILLDNHKSSVLFAAKNTGSVKITASVKQLDTVDPVSATLAVSSSSVSKPFENVYLIPNARIPFHLHTNYGQSIKIPQLKTSIQNSTVIHLDDDGVLTAVAYGHSTVTVEMNHNLYVVDAYVVEPSYIILDISPGKKWCLLEAMSYEITTKLFDSEHNEIHLSDNIRVHVTFPARLFYLNSSTLNGTFYSVRSVIPGSGKIKAEFLGIENKDGELIHHYELKVSQKFTIYQTVQVFPLVSLLPSYSSVGSMYSMSFKASGGTSFYVWSISSTKAKFTYNENDSAKVVVDFFDNGDYLIAATDKNSSASVALAKVSVQPVAEIEVYPTVVEAEVGNDIIIPVGLLGYESREKKILKMFDNCSKLIVSVEIIAKHVVTYNSDSEVPAFGRGCLSLQFICKLPGHSRINVYYNSSKDTLKTTGVVSCHKKLKAIHPVRVAVLALGTAKEVSFEGGPRPWPLFAKGHYESLVPETPNLVNITLIKDPYRYNRDLHVFRVLCSSLGETKLSFEIGNKQSPTNPNPAKQDSSLKLVCDNPYSIHLSYKSEEKDRKRSKTSGKEIVKVPFYGKKQFEIDTWVKDKIGRKFANISSLSIIWTVSDYTIAKPLEYNGLKTHVDGSAGYRKISRNFQEFQMTGKTGTLTISATITGYNEMVRNGNEFKPFEDIASSIELEFVSMRDLYEDVYQSDKEDHNIESCKE